MSEHSLLINLSALIQKPTGISVYAHNLVPELQALEPTILSSQPFTDTKCLPVSSRLTPEHGFKGHLRRLWWLQSSLPKIYQDLKSRLIFSPLPAAPLYSNCQIVITVHDLMPGWNHHDEDDRKFHKACHQGSPATMIQVLGTQYTLHHKLIRSPEIES